MALKISVYIACSLDGYIARSNGDLDWLENNPPKDPKEDFGYHKFIKNIDCLIMGRNSFEKVCSFDVGWPYSNLPCYILSTTLTQNDIPENIQTLGSVEVKNITPVDLVKELSKQDYKHLYIDGGKTIQNFLQHGLIDEITITQIPALLGNGIPLFATSHQEFRLKLLSSRTFENGFVQSSYQILKQ